MHSPNLDGSFPVIQWIRRSVFIACLAGFETSRVFAAEPVRIVELTQTPCQFVQGENGTDLGFTSSKAEDCKQVNRRTATKRLAAAKPLELKPGKYVFRIANKGVPYELGFWLRGASLAERARLPSTSGGGITEGKTQDYEIELKPGQYVYSCPLNPTPDYKLVVKE